MAKENKQVNTIKKVMVANRGEIAVRIFQSLQQMGITTVALFNEADRKSLHVRVADEALALEGETLGETYLNIKQIIQLAQAHGVDAIHPGYGFLSENAKFAQACQAAGIVFIGPSPEVIQKMGDKVISKQLMQQAGVPTLPGWTGSLEIGMAALSQEAEKIGYPLLVKAAAGGGGKGMRLVHHGGELESALVSAASEARNAFGDERVFLEKYLEYPRHVEFQIFGDSHGNVVHLFERECSIQRRHQKIIEETPCTALLPETRERMAEAALNAAKAVGYVNAGTVEFLLDAHQNFYFLEMNTRLQVEHPITELLVGRDLVREQIRVASGLPLSFQQSQLIPRGHALECRIYAEDPSRNFMPSIGNLLAYQLPPTPGIRLDSGVMEGDTVTVHFDPMLAKLVARGESREVALQRMEWALRHFVVLGVTHNIPFLRSVIAHPEFQQGNTHTHFLQEHGFHQPEKTEIPPLAWAAAALVATQTPSVFGQGTSSTAALGSEKPPSPWQLTGPWRAF